MAPTDAWEAMAWYLEEKSKEIANIQLELTDSWANNPSEESLDVVDRTELNEAEAFIHSMRDERSTEIRNSALYNIVHKETPTDVPDKQRKLSTLVKDVRHGLDAYEDALTNAGKEVREGALDTIREQVEAFAVQVGEHGDDLPLIAKSITGMEASVQWLQQRVKSLAAKGPSNTSATSRNPELRQERSNIKARSSRGRFAKGLTERSASTSLRRNQHTARSSAQHTAVPADTEGEDYEQSDVLARKSLEEEKGVESDEPPNSKTRNSSDRIARLPITKYARSSPPRKQYTARRSAQYSTTPAENGEDEDGRSNAPIPENFEENDRQEHGEEPQDGEDLDDGDHAGDGGNGGSDDDKGWGGIRGGRHGEVDESEDDACSLSSGNSIDSSDNDDESKKPEQRKSSKEGRTSKRGNFDKDRAPRYTPAETEKLVLLYGKFFGRKQLPHGAMRKIRRAFNKWLREKSVMANEKQVKRRKSGLRQQAKKLWSDGWRLEDGKAMRPSLTRKLGKRPAQDDLDEDEPPAQRRSVRSPPGAARFPRVPRDPREEHFITDENGRLVTVGPDDPRHDANSGRIPQLPPSTASPHHSAPAPTARFPTGPPAPQQPPVNPPAANPPPRLPTPPGVPPPGPEREAWLQRRHEAEADLRQRRTESPLSRIIAQNKKARHDLLFGFHRPGCGCGKP